MGLVHREVDPPLVPLVNVHQHQAAAHVPACIVLGSAPARIDQGEFLKSPGHKLGLVGSQLEDMVLSPRILKAQYCLFKFPSVQTQPVLMDILKADVLHLLPQHFSSLILSSGSSGTEPQYRVTLYPLHGLGQTIGIRNVHCLQIFLLLLFFLFVHLAASFDPVSRKHLLSAGFPELLQQKVPTVSCRHPLIPA